MRPSELASVPTVSLDFAALLSAITGYVCRASPDSMAWTRGPGVVQLEVYRHATDKAACFGHHVSER